MFACIHGAGELAKIAETFSPWFEQTSADTIVFPIGGLNRLYSSPDRIAQAIAQRAGIGVNIAIAETAESAILAARNFPGVTLNPDLDHLDISSLLISDAQRVRRAPANVPGNGWRRTPFCASFSMDMLETLDAWGIRDLQQLAQLPESGIAERFGEAGVYLQRLAKGAIQRPLRAFQPDIAYDDRIDLDHPVELLEPLLFLIARMLSAQCQKLEAHGMAAGEVSIRLELDSKQEHARTLRLPVPMRESKSLLKLLQMDLEAHPPQAATHALSVSIKPVLPRTVQTGIFMPLAPAPDKLELTLARIRGIVGEQNVGVPELVDTHHPHPYRLKSEQPQIGTSQQITDRQAFRYFRPPITAKVELQHDRPARLIASGIHGKVLNAAGPWRTSGNWWTQAAWDRDEWDITLTNGALYRIYCEPDQRWFVEGCYD
jgi:protein ImuB